MSKKIETYVKMENLKKLCEKHDIRTYTAREAFFGVFVEWREMYTEDYQVPLNGTPIAEFDVMSQVEMFDRDLSKLYETQEQEA